MACSYGSIYMGRPTMIKDSDSDMPLPCIDPVGVLVLRLQGYPLNRLDFRKKILHYGNRYLPMESLTLRLQDES